MYSVCVCVCVDVPHYIPARTFDLRACVCVCCAHHHAFYTNTRIHTCTIIHHTEQAAVAAVAAVAAAAVQHILCIQPHGGDNGGGMKCPHIFRIVQATAAATHGGNGMPTNANARAERTIGRRAVAHNHVSGY